VVKSGRGFSDMGKGLIDPAKLVYVI